MLSSSIKQKNTLEAKTDGSCGRDNVRRFVGWVPLASGETVPDELLSDLVADDCREAVHSKRHVRVYSMEILLEQKSELLVKVSPSGASFDGVQGADAESGSARIECKAATGVHAQEHSDGKAAGGS